MTPITPPHTYNPSPTMNMHMAQQEARKRAQDIVGMLSIEQKVSLLSGTTRWRTADFPEFNIQGMKLSDGPSGARGESMHASTPAHCFPCPPLMASTWDKSLLYEEGVYLAREVKSKGAQVLLAPTINLHRSVLGGRGFEAASEDPYLSGIAAAALIEGCQSQGVAASLKHLVCNEVETERRKVDTYLSKRALRELYLEAFRIAIKHSNPLTVMSSYNWLDGRPVADNREILEDVLRGEWGFKGAVISDWNGITSVQESMIAGVDLEMPGPALFRGQRVLDAVSAGTLDERLVTSSAERIIALSLLCGAPLEEERFEDYPEINEFIKRAATEGMVLLKNDPLPSNSAPLLPVRLTPGLKIGVVGSLANDPPIFGGGSAYIRVKKMVTPLEAISEQVLKFNQGLQPGEAQAEVRYSAGVPVFEKTPGPALTIMKTPSTSEAGADVDWFDGRDFSVPLYHEVLDGTQVFVIDPKVPGLQKAHSLRMSTILTPVTSGSHTFALTISGGGTLSVNGTVILSCDDNPIYDDGIYLHPGRFEVTTKVPMEAGKEYLVVLEGRSTTAPPPDCKDQEGLTPQITRFGFFEGLTGDEAINEARQVSSWADAVMCFVGTTQEYECEAFDRSDMHLPCDQNALVDACTLSNPATIVVNCSGMPVSMPWIGSAPSILQAFYGGEQVGSAISDLVFGISQPAGRLSYSWPVKVEDGCSYGSFPTEVKEYIPYQGYLPPAQQDGKARVWPRIEYEEGIWMGYRWFDRQDKPHALFGFGHGLTYTTFQTSDLVSSGSAELDEVLKLSAQVINTGSVLVSFVAQFYVCPPASSSIDRPARELRGFQKVKLSPGQSAMVEVELNREAFSFFDESVGKWKCEQGVYKVVMVDTGVVPVEVEVTISKDSWWL